MLFKPTIPVKVIFVKKSMLAFLLKFVSIFQMSIHVRNSIGLKLTQSHVDTALFDSDKMLHYKDSKKF